MNPLPEKTMNESSRSGTVIAASTVPDLRVQEKRASRVRRRRMLVALAVVSALAMILHRPLLTAVGRFFVIEDAITHGAVLWIHGGDGRFDIAAELYRRGDLSAIWLVQRRPDYLVREGIVPAAHFRAREQLLSAGVPGKAIVLLPGEARRDEDAVKIVGNEFSDQPAVRIVTLCDRFNCRYLRDVVDSMLAPAHSGQVALRGLSDAEFDETNWWRSRRGVKAVLSALTNLAHWHLVGSSSVEPPEWVPDEYERRLKAESLAIPCHNN